VATHEEPAVASVKIQDGLNEINEWAKKWRIKVNQKKPTPLSFALRNRTCPTVQMDNVALPQIIWVSIMIRRLTRAKHIKVKETSQPGSKTNVLATRNAINIVSRK
jgi:ATP adenylyltransferase/5',5'''-P-1,P-4-tetraphosphate phosphorylase II